MYGFTINTDLFNVIEMFVDFVFKRIQNLIWKT